VWGGTGVNLWMLSRASVTILALRMGMVGTHASRTLMLPQLVPAKVMHMMKLQARRC
jgi:hypothetical protein